MTERAGLVLAHGTRYLGVQAGLAVVIAAAAVVVFAGYLAAARDRVPVGSTA